MKFFVHSVLCFLIILSLVSCKRESKEQTPQVAPKEQNLPKIVAFGNSLTAGLGLSAAESYPAVLEKILRHNGYRYEVINAGVSGDTSSGGLRRIDWSLELGAKFLILELGANDILRGQPVDLIKENLQKIIAKAQSRNVTVLLVQMEAPTNSGPDYQKEVHQLYQDLAAKYHLVLIPFILKGLIGSDRYIQADGSHPTAAGARLVADNVYHSLQPLLPK